MIKELDQRTILSLPSTHTLHKFTHVSTYKHMRGGGAADVKRGESSEKIAIQVSSSAAAHFHVTVQKLPLIGKCAYRLHMYIFLISAGFWRMRRMGLDYFFK